METRLNIFLLLAFIFILGLNYEPGKDNNVAEPKKKTDFFEIQKMIQQELLIPQFTSIM